jgi:hypothetical protein
MAALLRAAVFYVQTAARDLIAAHHELQALTAALPSPRCLSVDVPARLWAFVTVRRAQRRGLPALPVSMRYRFPDAAVVDGVVQAPNQTLIWLMAGVRSAASGADLGYEQGGLDTAMSRWPDTGQPWRPRLDPGSLAAELNQLRTACWIVIAYLSGMRDVEVRELARDCAVTSPGPEGRTRHKLRGRVFKDRRLVGDDAEWVLLDLVHQAVRILTENQRRPHPPVRPPRHADGQSPAADQRFPRPRQRPVRKRRRAVHPARRRPALGVH